MTPSFEEFLGKRVLITGGLGFIGSNIAHRLIKYGAIIEIVDALIPKHGGNLYNVKKIEKDITIHEFPLHDDPPELLKIVERQDYIFNLAGQTSHWDSMLLPQVDLQHNCAAHLSLLECAKKTNQDVKIIFASTRQLYGKPQYLPVDETHPVNPVDINGIHKSTGEFYHKLYSQIYGLKTIILRLTNTIGPRMRIKDTRQTFLGYWIRCAIEGHPFEVWEGDQLRDLNYIEDVIDALMIALLSKNDSGNVYNLGAQPPLTLREIADFLSNYTNSKYIIKKFPDDRKSIDIGSFYSDFNLISNELKWFPKTDTKNAISKTVDYFIKEINHYV